MHPLRILLAFLYLFAASLIATPEANAFSVENRVGDFLLEVLDYAEENASQVVELHREKRPVHYDSASGYAVAANKLDNVGESFYRTMSQGDYDSLLKTGRLSGTRETFISPTRAFSESYDGVLVRFDLNQGTTDLLRNVGVRDSSKLTRSLFDDLPQVQRGWNLDKAFFKAEGGQINIGLGQGSALDVFNDNIYFFERLR